jgi:hypothetical protein
MAKVKVKEEKLPASPSEEKAPSGLIKKISITSQEMQEYQKAGTLIGWDYGPEDIVNGIVVQGIATIRT